MTKRSMSHFNKQLQGAYARGWADAYAKLWAELQLPDGIKLKDGRTARAVIEAAPPPPAEPTLVDEKHIRRRPPVEDQQRQLPTGEA